MELSENGTRAGSVILAQWLEQVLGQDSDDEDRQQIHGTNLIILLGEK